MDWSKAKTILIIALLITNVIIGGVYLNGKNKEEEALTNAARNAVAYAESHGVSISCQLPAEKKKLPVLFVSLERGASDGKCIYKGISVEADENFTGTIVPESQGDADGELISAADALLKLIDSLGEKANSLAIDDVSVVYWLDLSLSDDAAAKDTAIPTWKFSGPSGVYYIEAFGE